MKYIAKEESERTKLTLPIFLSLYSCNSTKRNDNELTVMKYWINQIRIQDIHGKDKDNHRRCQT